MKQCTVCLQSKPLSAFNNRKLSKDGKRYDCKVCNNAYSIAWQSKHKDKRKKHNATWSKNNRAKKAANWAKYNASKLKATPKWLTVAHLKEIEEFYIIAAELSWLSEGGLEVDHIMPLQGKNSCGLHVPWNLQVIPWIENRRKSNK